MLVDIRRDELQRDVGASRVHETSAKVALSRRDFRDTTMAATSTLDIQKRRFYGASPGEHCPSSIRSNLMYGPTSSTWTNDLKSLRCDSHQQARPARSSIYANGIAAVHWSRSLLNHAQNILAASRPRILDAYGQARRIRIDIPMREDASDIQNGKEPTSQTGQTQHFDDRHQRCCMSLPWI